MEIPYIVEPRKDTGLFNSKIAIWLFLASEVMLFGGLFSAYIFLRLGADFPWPERALPILPGLINTAILILSSMTVVLAWTELKLRNWRMFQLYMFVTIACAAIFMVFKGYEYKAKFTHQAVRTNSFSVIEGHVVPEDEKHPEGLGNYFRVKSHDVASFNGKTEKGIDVAVTLTRFHAPYFENIFSQSEGFKSRLFLNASNEKSYVEVQVNGKTEKFDASTELTIANLTAMQETFLANREEDNKLNRQLLKDAWAKFRDDRAAGKYPELSGKQDGVIAPVVFDIQSKLIAKAQAAGEYLNFISEEDKEAGRVALNDKVSFQLIGEGELKFVPAKGTFGGGTQAKFSFDEKKKYTVANVQHRDATTVIGEKGVSGLHIDVDGIDFRHFVMKWESDNLENKKPLGTFLGSVDKDGKYVAPTQPVYILKDALKSDGSTGKNPLTKIWETHLKWAHYRGIELEANGKELTHHEKYMVTWKQMIAYKNADYKCDSPADAKKISEDPIQKWYAGMYGPDHYNTEWKKAFPTVFVDREQVRLESNLTPKWNNYYAIYFTITGLHGLHVIGGALVLAYYLFFGRKMFLSNPEWLCNRVEVGGLFWHFVDLVWIFAFPIFYLM